MKRPQNFDELLNIAKNRPDVHGALSQLGISLKRVGHSMNGVRWQTETKSGTSGDLSAIAFIEKSDGSWIIFDNKGRIGQQSMDAITCLREIFGVSFDDAVYMLSGGAPSAPVEKPQKLTLERKAEPREERTYTPPTPTPDKLRHVKAYLIQTRKLPKELVLTLIDSGKISATERFKSKTAFCTFPITDENGNNVGTDMAATIDDLPKEYKKHLEKGSNADYAWCFPYEVEEITAETPIFFCEAPIDTMSLCALSGTPGVYVSMAGCKDRTFTSVAEKLGGKPIICVDNDETGDAFAARHPDVTRMVAPIGKDWNDTLKYYIQNNMSYAFAPPDAEAAPDVPLEDNVAHVHYEREDVDPKKENGALDKGASIQDKAITMDMPEEERAEILKNKTITPCSIEIHKDFNVDLEALENNKWSLIRSPLVNKMRELGFLREYKTDNIDISFSFTGESLKKSMHSQVSDYGGSLVDLSKVVMNMQKLLDSSVLIEMHSDKAKGTQKENSRLIQTYVLLSAYRENNLITPVQFEIKQYINNDNRLYLAVALTKREEDVISDTALHNEERTRLLSPSVYSIPKFIEKINPKDENFFKYIPNSFLSEEQKRAKANALAREAKKYGRIIDEGKPLFDESPIGADNSGKQSQDELRATLEAKAAPDVPLEDNVAHVHYEREDVDPKKENGALDKGASEENYLAETIDGRLVAVINTDILNGIDTSTWNRETEEAVKKAASQELKKFDTGIVVNGLTVTINKTSRREFTRSNVTKNLFKKSPEIFAQKMRVATSIDNIIVSMETPKNDGGLKKNRSDDFIDFYRGKTLFCIKEAQYEGTVLIGKTQKNQFIFYDLLEISPSSFVLDKKRKISSTVTPQQAFDDMRDPSINSIPENPVNVNTSDEKNSTSLYDKDPPIADNVGKHSQDELRATLEAKVADVVNNYRADPRALAEYVLFSSRFNNYSANNLRLIWSQYPYAQYVTSAYDFSHGLPDKDGKPTISEKIFIKKGEHALRIWKPYDVKYTVMPDGSEKRSARLTKSERELAKAEKWKELTRKYFTLVPVFDITQTTASPDVYPKLCGLGGVKGTSADARFNALKNYCENVLNCPIIIRDFGERKATVRGSFYPDLNEIHISDMLEGENKRSTALHEAGHAELHNDSFLNANKSTAQIELEADMYALMLECSYGVEPTDARCRHLKAHYDEYLAEIKSNDINADTELFNNVIERYRKQAPILMEYINNSMLTQTQSNEQTPTQSNDARLEGHASAPILR